jgi:hypothetical protein
VLAPESIQQWQTGPCCSVLCYVVSVVLVSVSLHAMNIVDASILTIVVVLIVFVFCCIDLVLVYGKITIYFISIAKHWPFILASCLFFSRKTSFKILYSSIHAFFTTKPLPEAHFMDLSCYLLLHLVYFHLPGTAE